MWCIDDPHADVAPTRRWCRSFAFCSRVFDDVERRRQVGAEECPKLVNFILWRPKVFRNVVVAGPQPVGCRIWTARLMCGPRRLDEPFVNSVANPHQQLVTAIARFDCFGKSLVVEGWKHSCAIK